jgi:hypothetical protein
MHTPCRSDRRSRALSERAAGMRHSPTPSEARLFEAVRGGRLGVSFRRQVPVLGKYIVDGRRVRRLLEFMTHNGIRLGDASLGLCIPYQDALNEIDNCPDY